MGQIHHPSSGKQSQKQQQGQQKDKKAAASQPAEEKRKATDAAATRPTRGEEAEEASLEGWESDEEGESQNEGEGSRTAARHYNQDLQKAIAEGDLEGDAEEARRALEGPEAEELYRAEQQGKRGPPKQKH